MDDETLELVTFDCPECRERISNRYPGGVPKSLVCTNCKTKFPTDRITGLDNTVRTEVPDTERLEALGPDGTSPGSGDNAAAGPNQRVDDTIDETKTAAATDTIRTDRTEKLWVGETKVAAPSRTADSPPHSRQAPAPSTDHRDQPDQPKARDQAAKPRSPRASHEPEREPKDKDAGRAENRSRRPERHRTAADFGDGETEPDSSHSGTWRTVGVLLAVVVVLAGAVAVVEYQSNSSERPNEPNSEEGSAADSNEDSDAAAIETAVAAALRRVHTARRIDPSKAELQLRVARRLADRGRHADASRIFDQLWQRRSDLEDRDFVDTYTTVLKRADRWIRLREVLVDMSQSDGANFDAIDPSIRRRFRQSIEEDPMLGNTAPVRLGAKLDADSMKPADDFDADGWMVVRNGVPTHVFRPAASDGPDWRDDVAAWRLCRLLACPFSIPTTRPAEITRAEFENLAAGTTPPDDLRWFEDERDDEKRRVVRGSLRRWPGTLVRWPIERTFLWRRWLGRSEDDTDFDEPFLAALRDAWNDESPSFFERLEPHASGLTVREFARQLSAVIGFDFLTNNWGRFADDEESWGSRNHLRNGRLTTVRTDTVFQRRTSRRVEGRFEWADRFSRDFVTAVGLLPREATADALYPEKRPATERKLEIFWDQRRALLDRIDSLVDEHGRDQILAFD